MSYWLILEIINLLTLILSQALSLTQNLLSFSTKP
jgi:hypothetical protein